MSSAYLRLLIFLPAILIPTCASSSLSQESCYLSKAKDKSALHILIYVICNALIASFTCLLLIVGFSGGASGKEPARQCRRNKRQRFDPWVGKILSRRKQQPTPIFLLGKLYGERRLADYSPWNLKQSEMTEHAPILSLHMKTLIPPTWFNKSQTIPQGRTLYKRTQTAYII